MAEFLLTLFAPIAGGLIYGAERVVRARMQNRLGPPLLQPFYDMFKLIEKRAFIIHPYHSISAIAHFMAMWAVVGMFIYGGDLLYIIFLHLLAVIFIVLGGFSVRSVFSHIGSNRELLALFAYEPVYILIASGFYLLNGTYDIDVIRGETSQLIVMFPFFIAFLLSVPVKLKKSPFDACEAHQEIVGGVEIEYSGIYFEFLYMAKWLEYVFVYLFLSLFAGNSFLLWLVASVILFFVLNAVDNSTARVKIGDMIKITLGFGMVLCVLNLIGIAYV